MKLKAVGCLIVMIIVPAILFLLAYFVVPGRCEDSRQCDEHLQAMWAALQRYAEDNDGQYPDRIELLHPRWVDLRTVRCSAWHGDRDSYETGYVYIAGTSPDGGARTPLLFCDQYHLKGHGPSTYTVQFGILLNNGRIVHVRDSNLAKYDGPMRRYPFFRRHPYDGSRPTLDLVRSLEHRFPDDLMGFAVIDEVEPETSVGEETPLRQDEAAGR